jgi:hypothetical protein
LLLTPAHRRGAALCASGAISIMKSSLLFAAVDAADDLAHFRFMAVAGNLAFISRSFRRVQRSSL